LKSLKDTWINKSKGVTQNNINQTILKETSIPIPPLPIQQKIVSKLDAFFSHYNRLKEEKRKARENYEKILQSAIASFLLKGKWKKERLGNICIINPKKSEIKDIPEDLDVSFVPMNSVDEKEGIIKKQEIRKLKDVKKGYTYFKENDVLFAKITPCMENGKAAITTNLKNGIGFGSTEFHVIRPNENMLADYIFYFIRQPSFRKVAAAKMSGTAGQLRVPSGFLENYEIPIPPIEEQKRIIKMLNKIKENFRLISNEQSNTDLQLSRLPKAVLSRAFRGEMVS
jgi:type I restriction enzyme, S subunit